MTDTATDIIASERASIHRQALDIVSHCKMLLDATKNCIEHSKCFPVYLSDLEADIRLLGKLAAQDVVLCRIIPRPAKKRWRPAKKSKRRKT